MNKQIRPLVAIALASGGLYVTVRHGETLVAIIERNLRRLFRGR